MNKTITTYKTTKNTEKEDEEETTASNVEQIRISLVYVNTATSTSSRENSQFSSLSSLEVPSEPIAVPITITKKGLNAVVNHLLDRHDSDDDDEDDDSDDERLPKLNFEFLLNNGKILLPSKMSIDDVARRVSSSAFSSSSSDMIIPMNLEEQEEAMEIQYFLGGKKPSKEDESEELPDWITSMTHSFHQQVLGFETNDDKHDGILSVGGDDGSIRIFSTSSSSLLSQEAKQKQQGGLNNMIQKGIVQAHSGSIKCMSSVSLSCKNDHQKANPIVIASGSIDQTLITHLCYNTNHDNEGNNNDDTTAIKLHAAYCNGHSSSINCVSLLNHPTTVTNDDDIALMASGDWDGGLCIWKVPSPNSSSNTDEDMTPSMMTDNNENKKRKTIISGEKQGSVQSSLSSVKEVSPTISIRAHNSNISGLSWGYTENNSTNNNDENILITSSWDHSIKSWDLTTQNNILTLNGSKVVTCISRCCLRNIIASGHPDCRVRLWDMRTSNGGNEVEGGGFFDGTLRPSHKEWISSIQWSPTNPYILLSSSYDGTIKVWDIRSTLSSTPPLYTLRAVSSGVKNHKVLCTSVTKDNVIYSGGTDCIVKQFKF